MQFFRMIEGLALFCFSPRLSNELAEMRNAGKRDALPYRLRRLEAVAGSGGTSADVCTGAVVDAGKDPG